MEVLHGLECRACGWKVEDAYVEVDALPPCPECDAVVTIWFGHGKACATDVYGVAKYSDATGQWHTSHRDKVKVMRKAGFEEAGDLVHGARADHKLKGKYFSYPGQPSRRSLVEG